MIIVTPFMLIVFLNLIKNYSKKLVTLGMKDLLLKKEFILKAIEEIRPNLSQLFPEQIEIFNSLDESVKKESFQNINREAVMLMMIELAKLKQHIIKKLERAV